MYTHTRTPCTLCVCERESRYMRCIYYYYIRQMPINTRSVLSVLDQGNPLCNTASTIHRAGRNHVRAIHSAHKHNAGTHHRAGSRTTATDRGDRISVRSEVLLKSTQHHRSYPWHVLVHMHSVVFTIIIWCWVLVIGFSFLCVVAMMA